MRTFLLLLSPAALMAGSALGEGIGILNPIDSGFHVFPRAVSNFQSFTGALGGASADPITSTGNAQHPFACAGATFPDFAGAQERSCANQHNACAAAANAGGNKGAVTVGGCDGQQTQCLAAPQASNGSAVATSVIQTSANVAPPPGLGTTTLLQASPTLFSSDASFFYFCEPTAA